jgi:hypothetical protein
MFTAPTLALLLAAPPGAHTLQWKFAEGDVFYNKGAMTMEQTMEVQGRTVEQKMEVATVLRFAVKSAKPGATVVEMTYLDTKITAPGQAGPNTGEKLKGVAFTATLDAKLKVTKLEGYDKFLDALADGDDEKKKLMKSLMPEAMIRRSFDQTFQFAPNRAVAVGDAWDSVNKVPLGALGALDVKYACKLEGVKGDVATVAIKGEMEFKGGGGEGLPFKINKIDLKSDRVAGSYQFDTKAGRPVGSKMELEMGGTLSIEAGGMTADMKMKQKMTMISTITATNPLKD